jgi:undecaprenyl-diphosphatase
MSSILLLDTKLLFFINQSLANPVFDIIMPFVTNLNNWKIPILLVWILLMVKGGKKGRVVGILLILVLLVSDQLSSTIIKPLIGRYRPCHLYDNLRLLVNCGGKYAFPSSHASNIAAFAVLFSYFYRKWTAVFVIVATIVGFSRIYVGVHFPIDVLAGYSVGIFSAFLIINLYFLGTRKYSIFLFQPSEIHK